MTAFPKVFFCYCEASNYEDVPLVFTTIFEDELSACYEMSVEARFWPSMPSSYFVRAFAVLLF